MCNLGTHCLRDWVTVATCCELCKLIGIVILTDEAYIVRFGGARSVAVSYKPPMLVTPVRLPAYAF